MQIYVDMDGVLTDFNRAIEPVLTHPAVENIQRQLAQKTRNLGKIAAPVTISSGSDFGFKTMGEFFQKYMPAVDEFKTAYDNWRDAIGKCMPTGFFLRLELMPGARELMDGIRLLCPVPTILTKPVNKTGDKFEMQCRVEKLHWMMNWFGKEPFNFLCVYDKSEYSGFGKILIDDQPKNIREWVSKGGTGILHEGASSTLEILKSISLKAGSNQTGNNIR